MMNLSILLLKICIAIILFFIGGIWRRMFGGLTHGKFLLENRFFQHIIGFSILFCIMFFSKTLPWYLSLLYAIAIQGIFWAPAHGAFFDIGRNDDGNNPEMVKRYKNTLGNKIIEKILPKNLNYGFIHDSFGMLLRYTIPTLVFIPYLWRMIIIGPIVAFIYVYCWELFTFENGKFKLPKMINGPTQLAEFLSGGIVYFYLFCYLYFIK